MQIFLSHSSRQKPLVREVKRNLPECLDVWLDEQKLIFGDSVPASLEAVLKTETDYVLLFIDEYAAASPWVSQEIEWAFEAEKNSGRTILLPIVIDEEAADRFGSVELRNRKHLSLPDFTEASIRSLAEALTSSLFALMARDLQSLRSPKPRAVSSTVSEASEILHAKSILIEKAVFPHRQSNPLSLQALRDAVNSQLEDPLDPVDFDAILTSVMRVNLIPGLYFDGYEVYLVEEHSLWKSEVNRDRKERIGRRVSALIKNGATVFLDAGSTSGEVASVLVRRLQNRALTNIRVATTSISIASLVSQCCVSMGFDDSFSAVRLYVPGGRVREATQAIVGLDASMDSIADLAEQLGGFDVGVIGVNGVDLVEGFTTHDNAEVVNKKAIMRASKTRLLVGDSSKLGIVLEEKFAQFADDLVYIVDNDPNNELLVSVSNHYHDKVILA
jgi:DeoR/GlpR family transcriptional regulator of sugar metabolism